MAAQFTILTAPVAPLELRNVDTDQIIPARFLKMPRAEGYGRFLFHDLRFRHDGSEDPGFVLNQASYRDARILVGNENFGCGSSREGAVYALYDHGFRAVVAPSFHDIFFNNCLKNGIIPVRLDAGRCATLRKLVSVSPGSELTVDLMQCRVSAPDGTSYEFSIDEFFRGMLLKGVDELQFTLDLLPDIEAFESAYSKDAPWIQATPAPQS